MEAGDFCEGLRQGAGGFANGGHAREHGHEFAGGGERLGEGFAVDDGFARVFNALVDAGIFEEAGAGLEGIEEGQSAFQEDGKSAREGGGGGQAENAAGNGNPQKEGIGGLPSAGGEADEEPGGDEEAQCQRGVRGIEAERIGYIQQELGDGGQGLAAGLQEFLYLWNDFDDHEGGDAEGEEQDDDGINERVDDHGAGGAALFHLFDGAEHGLVEFAGLFADLDEGEGIGVKAFAAAHGEGERGAGFDLIGKAIPQAGGLPTAGLVTCGTQGNEEGESAVQHGGELLEAEFDIERCGGQAEAQAGG